MNRVLFALLSLCLIASPATAGRRFTKNAAQIPMYYQTHTAPYSKRVAVVYDANFLSHGPTDASTGPFVRSMNTRLGAMWDELRERGAEVHFYDSHWLMDSTSSLPDAAGEQGQPIWNYLGNEYPVVVLVGFRSQFEGTANDTRPFYNAYSCNAKMIHLSWNVASSLRDLLGANNNGCGASLSSFATSSASVARVNTYYGARDTISGRQMMYTCRVSDDTLNAGIHSVVRMFKPVASEWSTAASWTGVIPADDDTVAKAREIMPLAYRVYWKVPSTSTKGRSVDYVLMGSTGDDERINWQHIATALVLRYTTIPPIPVGWIDSDDNGNWAYDARWRFQSSPTNTAALASQQRWPRAALMDSLMRVARTRWGMIFNHNGQFDSLAYYKNTYGYRYLSSAYAMTSHAHDTVNTHVYGNIFGKSSQNNDSTFASPNGPRTTFYHVTPSNRTSDPATRNLGIYWRLRDHITNVRREFGVSGGHYLNAPNGDGLPLGIRTFALGGASVAGNGNCPPDSFFLGLAYAGIHSVSAGFEFDYQVQTSPELAYMHTAAKSSSASPRKWFTWGDESWTLPAGSDPEGRYHVTGEERRVESCGWGSLSEDTPQDVSARETNSPQYANTLLGLRRTTWMRPQIRYSLGETSVPATVGATTTRARNTAFNRVRVTNTHLRQATSPGATNSYVEWDLIARTMKHLSVMDQIAGRPTYRFTTPWQTRQGPN